MSTFLPKIWILVILSGFILTGCEKEEIMMSSSKVDSQLQSNWAKVNMTSTGSTVVWNFSGGTVFLMNNNNDTLVQGTYKVDASMTKVNINIKDFPEPGYDYMNSNWQVITLDDNVLVIAGKDHGGILEQEFTKKN